MISIDSQEEIIHNFLQQFLSLVIVPQLLPPLSASLIAPPSPFSNMVHNHIQRNIQGKDICVAKGPRSKLGRYVRIFNT
jgi:hypothetical protein